jgi:methylenetetrahydrofolate reductase (NADPH)
MCGAEIPRWLERRLSAYADDASAIRAYGVEVVSDLCRKLIAGGAPGLHFYTLNRAKAVLGIVEQL